MKKELPDEALPALLQDWKVDAELSPRFSDGVWRRIAEREAKVLSTSWSARLNQWLSGFNSSRDLACGAVAAVVVTAGAGWMGLRTTDYSSTVAPSPDSYLASVDPYRMNR